MKKNYDLILLTSASQCNEMLARTEEEKTLLSFKLLSALKQIEDLEQNLKNLPGEIEALKIREKGLQTYVNELQPGQEKNSFMSEINRLQNKIYYLGIKLNKTDELSLIRKQLEAMDYKQSIARIDKFYSDVLIRKDELKRKQKPAA